MAKTVEQSAASTPPVPERTCRAAVLHRVGESVELAEVGVQAPGPGEVRVRMGATGICQSDVSVFEGRLPNPLPMVLGHEGAGMVDEVGLGVPSLTAGDHVVLSWLAQCEACFYCLAGQPSLCETANGAMLRGTLPDGNTRFSITGEPVYHMAGLGTFSEYCVVPAEAAIRIPPDIGFPQAALLGCGVLTGFGSAVNAAAVRTGETVAVVGCGGVGLNAVQGARIAGAREIIAVDRHHERLELARELGATHVLSPGEDLVKQIGSATAGRGVDVAIEAAGQQDSISSAVRMTRRGGRTVLVGAGPQDVRLDVSAFNALVVTEKTIIGSFYGSARVARDVELLTALYDSGQLALDELVSRTFTFDTINDALTYCAEERGARAVVVFDGEQL